MTKDGTRSSLARVFLCHASEDKAAVRQLYHRLVTDGFAVWLDEEVLLPGQDWRIEIDRAVRQSDVIIICLSKRSITKAGFVQKEIKLALDAADEKPEGAIFLIPAMLEECRVPERLARFQWTNLTEAGGYERLKESLAIASSKAGSARVFASDTKSAIRTGIAAPRGLRSGIEERKSGHIRQLTVRFSAAASLEENRRRIKAVYDLLVKYPGKDLFSFHLREQGRGVLLDFPGDSTALSEGLLIELHNMLDDATEFSVDRVVEQ